MTSTITTFPVNTVEIITHNADDDAIAFHVPSSRYFLGMIDGDTFINGFNIKFKVGRDDAQAVAYFTETYGLEA